MALQFNDTTNYQGIVQVYEDECGFNRGDISGDTNKLKQLTRDVNLAMSDFLRIALMAGGTWQFDDSNQTDYPIITTNLVAGQRDYPFTTDASGNLILDIYRVFCAQPSGIFIELLPVDVESGTDRYPALPGTMSGQLYNYGSTTFTDGSNTQGTPVRYDLMSNAVFLDPIPNYNFTGGLKLYVNREATYFQYTDTTKKPGVPGLFHRYFALKPALDYARRNQTANFAALQNEVTKMEGNEDAGIVGTIAEYFSERPREDRRRMTVLQESNR